ncbi:MAG: SDR family oxidoreductase [Desulfuromusa sp.]|nr:SDR family oxidoreductase [Desulfuromusa sp.]
MMMTEQRSRIALITGATRGIGRAIAEHFAKEDCRLALAYRSNRKEADETERVLKDRGVEVLMIQADLTDHVACREVVDRTVNHFGQLDILVNNAGTTYDGAFAVMKPEEYVPLIRGNCCAPVLLSLYAAPHLIASAEAGRNGAIVMMSSMAGITGKEGQVPYSTTKGSLIGATRLLARHFGPRGVRVNALAPGFIRTDMVKALNPKMYNHVLEASASPRMGEPQEVAGAAWFLASHSSSYINGQVHRIDGGFLR